MPKNDTPTSGQPTPESEGRCTVWLKPEATPFGEVPNEIIAALMGATKLPFEELFDVVDLGATVGRKQAADALYELADIVKSAADDIAPIRGGHRLAWRQMAEAMGITLEELAERAGVDLENGTVADGDRINRLVAGVGLDRAATRRAQPVDAD